MTPAPRKKYLLAPGPTPVPEEILLAIAAPTIHHRTPEFEAVVTGVRAGLRAVFQTEQDVIVLISNCPQLNNPCNGWNPTPAEVLVWN